MNLSTPFLQVYQNQFASYLPFRKPFEDESYVIKDKSDKSSLEQQFHKSDMITFVAQKFRNHAPIYNQVLFQVDWLADKIWVNFNF